MKVTSRKEAINLGLKYYFTGKPCKHGHVSKRKSYSGVCYECFITKQRESYDSEKACARVKDYYSRNREKRLDYAKRYNLKNREARAEYQKKWYSENRKSQIKSALDRKKEKPDLNSKWSNDYRARKLRAIPSWFESDLVVEVYNSAREKGLQVDHIVPLKNDIVCGLHCFSNLQLLDGSENASKGNRYWPDMP